MRERMQIIWQKIRKALVSDRSRECLVFLFFLLVAAIFWMLQTLDETLNKEVTVPLELVNVPEDVVIITPPPGRLRVVVRDKGTSLVHYIRHKMEPLRIPFPEHNVASDNGHVRIQNADIHRMVQDCLLPSSEIISISPDTLDFYYNHGLSKTVPVVVAGTIDISPDHYLLDVHTNPSEVTVWASASVLDTLTAVYTSPVELLDIAANTTKNVALQPIRGTKFSAEGVKLEVLVDVYMENTLSVPIHTSNFPPDIRLTTFPSEVQITYTVGYTQNKDITADDFVILFTYEQVLDFQRQGKEKLPLTLRSVPENVTDVSIEPHEVDFLVEKKDVEE